MQRCWISKVWGYSAWSMKLRWRLSSITRRASGSIQVVTKVARLRSGIPSTASSSLTRRIAAMGAIGSSGMASSGAPSVIQAPSIWTTSRARLIQILLISARLANQADDDVPALRPTAAAISAIAARSASEAGSSPSFLAPAVCSATEMTKPR